MFKIPCKTKKSDITSVAYGTKHEHSYTRVPIVFHALPFVKNEARPNEGLIVYELNSRPDLSKHFNICSSLL